MQKIRLDKEEQDILDSFERGEWKPAANRIREIARHVRYARNTMAKDRRVNIRISSTILRESRPLPSKTVCPIRPSWRAYFIGMCQAGLWKEPAEHPVATYALMRAAEPDRARELNKHVIERGG